MSERVVRCGHVHEMNPNVTLLCDKTYGHYSLLDDWHMSESVPWYEWTFAGMSRRLQTHVHIYDPYARSPITGCCGEPIDEFDSDHLTQDSRKTTCPEWTAMQKRSKEMLEAAPNKKKPCAEHAREKPGEVHSWIDFDDGVVKLCVPYPARKPTRPDWEDYFLGIAKAVAARADCTRRKVGAVIVDTDRRIVGTGYNGAPSGGKSCLAGQCSRGRQSKEDVAPGSSYDTGAGACIALHAEQNALAYSDYSKRKGGSIYITCEPCEGCWRELSGSGIRYVYWSTDNSGLAGRWSRKDFKDPFSG